jgi:hypothetical protein
MTTTAPERYIDPAVEVLVAQFLLFFPGEIGGGG